MSQIICINRLSNSTRFMLYNTTWFYVKLYTVLYWIPVLSLNAFVVLIISAELKYCNFSNSMIHYGFVYLIYVLVNLCEFVYQMKYIGVKFPNFQRKYLLNIKHHCKASICIVTHTFHTIFIQIELSLSDQWNTCW